MDFLSPHFERIYAATRILAGVMFMFHGIQKVFGLFGGPPPGAPPFIVYGAGGIELVCGALIAVGLFAAPAAFLSSGTMAVAYFMAHQPEGLFPIQNGGELAILYCWIFFMIAARGAGTFSLDDARASIAD